MVKMCLLERELKLKIFSSRNLTKMNDNHYVYLWKISILLTSVDFETKRRTASKRTTNSSQSTEIMVNKAIEEICRKAT